MVKSYTNLQGFHPTSKLPSILELDSESSSKDSTYDDLADNISHLTLNDDFTADTKTVGYKSVAFIAKKGAKRQSAIDARAKIRGDLGIDAKQDEQSRQKKIIAGNTTTGLPFIIDLWRDRLSRSRMSVQVHLLSGNDSHTTTFARVSTDQSELVIMTKMNPFMSRSDFAFNTFVLKEHHVSQEAKQYLLETLKIHPKSTGRMVSVSKVKGRSIVGGSGGFFYEQRIRLPRKAEHAFATMQDGDDFFYGRKFVQYPDGSVHLHVELLAEKNDNYVPEECMLDPQLVKTVPTNQQQSTFTMPMDTTEDLSAGTHVLNASAQQSTTTLPTFKRARVETVEDEDDDYEEATVEEEEEEEEDKSCATSQSAAFASFAATGQFGATGQFNMGTTSNHDEDDSEKKPAAKPTPRSSSLQAALEEQAKNVTAV